MATQLLRLVANQVKVGVALPFGVRDEGGNLLLARGQVVLSEQQLQALLARGLFVDQEELRLAREGRPLPPDARQKPTLFDLWEQASWHLERLHKSVGEGPGFAARCDEFVTQLIDLVQRDADIAIFLSMRQDPRRRHLYGLTHALHAALVCQLMARRMGWTEPRMRTQMCAALTMNMAITELQGRCAVMGRLADAQLEQVRLHPMRAVEVLREAGVDDELWLQVVAEHHERVGGGGYPGGLARPCDAAIALRAADVFMARITPRAGRPALSVQDAARQMFAEAQGHPAAAALITEYGIYPPGNVVLLASGEQAVVIRRGATAHTPIAATITDKAGMPATTCHRRDTAQPAFAIKGLAADGPVAQRVPPQRLYGLAG